MDKLWEGLGIAAVILAITFGIGSCTKMIVEAEKSSVNEAK